jgi:hypothetical protein
VWRQRRLCRLRSDLHSAFDWMTRDYPVNDIGSRVRIKQRLNRNGMGNDDCRKRHGSSNRAPISNAGLNWSRTPGSNYWSLALACLKSNADTRYDVTVVSPLATGRMRHAAAEKICATEHALFFDGLSKSNGDPVVDFECLIDTSSGAGCARLHQTKERVAKLVR